MNPVPPPRASKRSRAAEIHNLSEKVSFKVVNCNYLLRCDFVLICPTFRGQRRRSRINEKLKALQKLIPNSNKVVISEHVL